MTYFNTTHETGITRIHYEAAAETQNDRVLAFYAAHPGDLLAPSTVWRETGLESEDVPLTSVRRSITTLEKAGKLAKTGIKRQGVYGRPETCWVYPRPGRAASGSDLLL